MIRSVSLLLFTPLCLTCPWYVQRMRRISLGYRLCITNSYWATSDILVQTECQSKGNYVELRDCEKHSCSIITSVLCEYDPISCWMNIFTALYDAFDDLYAVLIIIRADSTFVALSLAGRKPKISPDHHHHHHSLSPKSSSSSSSLNASTIIKRCVACN